MKIKTIVTSSFLLVSFGFVPCVFANEINSTSTMPEIRHEFDKPSEGMERNRIMGTSSSTSTKPKMERKDDFKLASGIASSTLKEHSTTTNSMDRKDNKNNHSNKHRENSKNLVQDLLKLSDKIGNLGTNIKAIANEQASSTEVAAEAIEKVEGRSGFKTFLIGTDYKNLGTVISEINKTENRLNQLKNEIQKIASSTEKVAAETQIVTLEKELNDLKQFVTDNQTKFSLFGWVVKMFNK